MVRTPKCFSQFLIIEFGLLGRMPNWLHPILRRSAHILAVFQVDTSSSASYPFPHIIPRALAHCEWRDVRANHAFFIVQVRQNAPWMPTTVIICFSNPWRTVADHSPGPTWDLNISGQSDVSHLLSKIPEWVV